MIKLVDILNETKALKTVIKKSVNETKSRSIRLFVVEDVLQSGALSISEANALREFFNFRKSMTIPVLNENTIRLIDGEMLKEGFFDWIKDKASKFKNALSSGWDKLKGAWNNFKDFVAGLVTQIKEGLRKAFDTVVEKLKSAMDWGSDVANKVNELINKNQADLYAKIAAKVAKKAKITPEEVHETLPVEVNTFQEASKHLFKKTKEVVVDATTFTTAALEGDTKGEVKLEGINGFLKNKKLVEVLIKLNESALKHPEDLLEKYPLLHKVVKVVVNIFKWTFGIFSALVKQAGQLITQGFLAIVNFLSNITDGPVSPSKYALMSALVGELAEIAGHKIHMIHEYIEMSIDFIAKIVVAACPAIAPYVAIAREGFHIAGTFFFVYAIATVILNVVVPVIKKLVDWIDSKMSDPEFAKKLASIAVSNLK
jgi:hypothetical protein